MLHKVQAFPWNRRRNFWADGPETFRYNDSKIRIGLCVTILPELLISFSPIIYISSYSYGNFFNLYSLDLTNFKGNFITNLMLILLKSRSGVTVALSPTVSRPFMLQVSNDLKISFFGCRNKFHWLTSHCWANIAGAV